MNKCFVCGNTNNRLQKAHIIGNRVVNKRIYGDKIIDSEYNILFACDLHCNSLIDLGSQKHDKERVALIIESEMDDSEKREAIESIVRENIKRKERKIGKAI